MTDVPPQPLQPNYYGAGTDGPRPAGLAIAGMVCGIVGLVSLCLWYVSIPLAIVAVVLGLVARRQVHRGVARGGGMALAGVICGTVTLALDATFALIVALVLVFHARIGF